MADQPINLDERRDEAERKSAAERRLLPEVAASQAALTNGLIEFEELLTSGPAKTWSEAAARAMYLIKVFEQTKEAQEPRYKKLIEQTIADLTRMGRHGKKQS